MSQWDYKEEILSSPIKQWKRSPHQEFYTELGGDFTVVAKMEEVKTLDNVCFSRTSLTPITRSLSRLTGTQLEKAAQIQYLLTQLIEEWKEEDAARNASLTE